MQYRSAAPRPRVETTRRERIAPTFGSESRAPVRPRVGTPVEGRRSPPCEVRTFGVEYLVRAARVTDIDRLVALSAPTRPVDRGASPLDAADLLRQLVYLPQASIFVAEAQRVVVGGAVLALRPSVRASGYVGTIDLLVVDPDHDADRVTAALLEEVIRSASNKGCTLVEAISPEPVDLDRWAAQGFVPAGPRIQRPVAAAGAARRT
jgi:GNAT superfamily N-acetyltransferase